MRHRDALPFSRQYPIDGDGWMPLFCAIQWVVTEGDTLRDPPANDRSRWFEPIRAVIQKAESGDLHVKGRQLGKPLIIDPTAFSACSIAYPFEDVPEGLLRGETTYLRLVDYEYEGELPDEHDGRDPAYNLEWHEDMNDALWRDGSVLYSHLLVPKVQVRENWSRSDWIADIVPKKILIEEMERRYAASEGKFYLKSGSADLAKWYRTSYPKQRPLAAETIRKHIRPRHQELRLGGPPKLPRTPR